MTAKESLRKLKEGNVRFVTGKALHPMQDKERINVLSGGQKPFAIM